MTVDAEDNAYVTGVTLSNDFPVTASAVDKSANGNQDAFLFKLDADGKALVYSTYLGGSQKDGGRGVVVDKSGKAYLTGCTKSTDFPVTADAYDKTFNGAGTDQWAWGDPFLLVMNAEGSNIEYCTYIGGSADEEAYGIALDKQGSVYLCGVTSSANFPTTPGAFDRSLSGGCNCYVTKFQFSITQPAIDYLGQAPPGETPVIFARGIISDVYQQHGAPSFTPDGNQVFWQTNHRPPSDNEQWLTVPMTMRRIKGKWTPPEKALHDQSVLSLDGKRLYYPGDKGTGPFYIERQGDNWSDPVDLNLVARFPELQLAVFFSFTNNGTLYFVAHLEGLWCNIGIYRSECKNGEYTKPEPLPQSINLPPYREWTPFIAPDESYLIFCSTRWLPESDQGDLFICFRLADGSWTEPVNMGAPINTGQLERFPTVSPDGKYLFFTRDTEGFDEDAYWVSAGIIGRLKAMVMQ